MWLKRWSAVALAAIAAVICGNTVEHLVGADGNDNVAEYRRLSASFIPTKNSGAAMEGERVWRRRVSEWDCNARSAGFRVSYARGLPVSMMHPSLVADAGSELLGRSMALPSTPPTTKFRRRAGPGCYYVNSKCSRRGSWMLRASMSRQVDRKSGFTARPRGRPRGRPKKNTARNEPPPVDDDDILFLRFSRAFQRHVVYRSREGRLKSDESSCGANGDPNRIASSMSHNHYDKSNEVMASFLFLDEAMSTYPDATIIEWPDDAPGDFDRWNDVEWMVPGAGCVSSSELLRPNATSSKQETNTSSNAAATTTRPRPQNAYDAKGWPGYDALMYLASLAASVPVDQIHAPPGSAEAKRIKDSAVEMLLSRVGMHRFGCHTPGSIRRNYNRIMDMLTRGRRPLRSARRRRGESGDESGSLEPDDGGWSVAASCCGRGLAFSEKDARAVIAGYPVLCLYDFNELETRVNFLMDPFSPRVLSGEGGGAATRTTEQPSVGPKRKTHSKMDEVDWPRIAWEGNGAGLTIEQATLAINAVPELLALTHDDARKPPVIYRFTVPEKIEEGAFLLLEDYLSGAEPTDIRAFAYLRTIGIGWEQIRVLLDAFSSITASRLDPNWELKLHSHMRSILHEETLLYLRKRFQVGSTEIYNMLKTHSQLSAYTVAATIKPMLDVMQSRLNLTSRELRKVVLRNPSLLGVKIDGFVERLDFFFCEAKMDQSELRKAFLKFPPLFSYSVQQSLRPKLRFLLDELMISPAYISRVISTVPEFMGKSLEQNLRPTAVSIMVRCHLSVADVGNLVVMSPLILKISQKAKIEPNLAFLSQSLGFLDERELGRIVEEYPRILLQSVELTFAPKIKMLEESIQKEREIGGVSDSFSTTPTQEAAEILKKNPGWLERTNLDMSKRIEKYLEKGEPLSDAFLPQNRGSKKKTWDFQKKRHDTCESEVRWQPPILAKSPDGNRVFHIHSSVTDAAISLEVEPEKIHDAIMLGTLLNGTRFEVASKYPPTIAARHKRVSKQAQKAPDLLATPPKTESISVFVSSRIYPTESIDVVRESKRYGGLAIHFPQVRLGGEGLSERLRLAADASFGNIVPEEAGGSDFSDGLILLPFPFLRPSRNRCALYACHGALKVVFQLLKQAAQSTDVQNINYIITIYTDSSYAWKILQDDATVERWGSFPTQHDFVSDGSTKLPNLDLLYPLARTLYRLLKSEETETICFGKTVQVRFYFSRDLFLGAENDSYISKIDGHALRAAMWQYDLGRMSGNR